MSATPPDIAVDYSTLWAHVRLGDDLAAWSGPAAERVWAGSGQPFSRLDLERLGAKLELLAESALGTQCFGAFFLCPQPARGPIAVVRLIGITYEPGTPDDEVVRTLLLPPDLQLVAPQTERLPGTLRCVRMIQRAYDERTRAIADYLTWVFLFGDAAWLLSVSFPDPRDAQTWLPELDALAAGVQLVEGAP